MVCLAFQHIRIFISLFFFTFNAFVVVLVWLDLDVCLSVNVFGGILVEFLTSFVVREFNIQRSLMTPFRQQQQ